MSNEMFNDFGKVNEIIEGADYRAVRASVALGGLSIEAFQKEDDVILRVVSAEDNNKVDVYYARITEDEFDDLSSVTEWHKCGALSQYDVVLTEAAQQWVMSHPELKFYKQGRGRQKNKMIACDFIL